MANWRLRQIVNSCRSGAGPESKYAAVGSDFLAIGQQTGGAYALIETANNPSRVPFHLHEREDEAWFVIEGEYTFEVSGRIFRAGRSDYVFGPRTVSTVMPTGRKPLSLDVVC